MTALSADRSDPRVGVARLLGGKRILRSQLEVLRACASDSPVEVLGIFGGWGAGKTTTEQLAALSIAIQNPWTEAYGLNRPCTLMMTETVTVMRDSLYAAMMDTFPEGIITREVRTPSWDLELANGHVIALRTDKGSMEGKTVVATIIDEVHKLKSKRNYLNYLGRARDRRSAKNITIASGLPIDNGWLREEFDRKNPGLKRKTIYMRTADNIHLRPGYIDLLRSSCSAKEAKTQLEAEWHVFEGAIYDDFDSTKHLVNDAGDRRAPVHIGLDAGHKAALVVVQDKVRTFGQETAMGLHVVDELLPNSTSVEIAMREFFARGWRLVPGVSYVCVDPKVSDDQIASIRRVCAENGCAGIQVVQKLRGDPAESVLYGIRCVQAAMLDAAGRIKLTFSRSLPESAERGLRTALGKYRWNPKTRQPVKDDKIDHVLDALRYVVAHRMPARAGVPTSMDDFTRPA